MIWRSRRRRQREKRDALRVMLALLAKQWALSNHSIRPAREIESGDLVVEITRFKPQGDEVGWWYAGYPNEGTPVWVVPLEGGPPELWENAQFLPIRDRRLLTAARKIKGDEVEPDHKPPAYAVLNSPPEGWDGTRPLA